MGGRGRGGEVAAGLEGGRGWGVLSGKELVQLKPNPMKAYRSNHPGKYPSTFLPTNRVLLLFYYERIITSFPLLTSI